MRRLFLVVGGRLAVVFLSAGVERVGGGGVAWLGGNREEESMKCQLSEQRSPKRGRAEHKVQQTDRGSSSEGPSRPGHVGPCRRMFIPQHPPPSPPRHADVSHGPFAVLDDVGCTPLLSVCPPSASLLDRTRPSSGLRHLDSPLQLETGGSDGGRVGAPVGISGLTPLGVFCGGCL